MFTGYEFADEDGIGTGKIVHVPTTINYKEALKNTTIFTSTVMFDMEQLSKRRTADAADQRVRIPRYGGEYCAGGTVACGLDENLVKYRRAGEIPVFQQDRSSAQDLESVS